VVWPTNAVASGPQAKHHAKTGTYKAKTDRKRLFNITLQRTKCTSAPGQGTAAQHLCVAIPRPSSRLLQEAAQGAPPPAPWLRYQISQCTNVTVEDVVTGFEARVPLPASDHLIEHAPVTDPLTPELTGQATFSVTFTKKGTASGYLEFHLMVPIGHGLVPCSGKDLFTAKLG
jgi:hypothetical protein